MSTAQAARDSVVGPNQVSANVERRELTNAEIGRILREISILLDMQAVPFKPRAYEKAADAVDHVEQSLAELFRQGGRKAIEKVPGVGKSIAEKIATLIESGRLPFYDELHAKTPVDLAGLTAVEGLGPKHIRLLYEELGVRTLAELEEAGRDGRIRSLAGFGEKSEQRILRGIEFLKQTSGRFPLDSALRVVEEIAERLRAMPEVERASVAGSIRRRQETIGDGDIVVVSAYADAVMERFAAMPEVMHIHGKGSTKSSVKLRSGMDVDLRVVPAESWGAALLYFTGSKAHNVALRRIAVQRGLKLNEYGLLQEETSIAGKSEEEVYAALDLPYIPPEMREDSGEIEAAAHGELPQLIEYGDLRGDLQTQTDWTDGADSLEDMVAAAERLGHEYIAITDHTKSLAMMGADEAQLRRQMQVIDALNEKERAIRVLKSAEVNILRDGTLDIGDDLLAELDVVGIAVHSHFNLTRAEQTQRIVRAMENPHADILFHPTGRLLQKREAYEVDIDAVIAAAKRTGTVLEIDSYPDRLDLKDEHVRKAVAAGVKIAIDTDAHAVTQLGFLHFGIATARRGWATKADVVNTRPMAEFLRCLKRGARS